MRYLILAWVLLASCGSEAADGFQLRKAAIEGGQYVGTNHDFYLNLDNDNGERLQHSTDLVLDVDMACSAGNDVCLYWNNRVASKASNQQYREVGWVFSVGFSIGAHVEVSWMHSSFHELDRRSNPGSQYPLENRLVLNLLFVNSPRKIGGR